MILHEFPNLTWLKQQIGNGFGAGKGWDGTKLRHSGWPSVILNATVTQISRKEIKGPLSLFTNRKGKSTLKVNGRTVVLEPNTYFLTNPGQYYTLEIDDPDNTETFNIHFGEQLVTETFSSQVLTVDQQLTDPGSDSLKLPHFDNHIRLSNTELLYHFEKIRTLPTGNTPQLEEHLTEIVTKLIRLDKQSMHRILSLPAEKASTKEELMKRLLRVRDQLYSCYSSDVTLNELATTACLSKYHMLRLFKACFGITPHQFLTGIRMNKVCTLLKTTNLPLTIIAEQVGLENASSLSRLFKKHTGCSPTQFRQEIRK